MAGTEAPRFRPGSVEAVHGFLLAHPRPPSAPQPGPILAPPRGPRVRKANGQIWNEIAGCGDPRRGQGATNCSRIIKGPRRLPRLWKRRSSGSPLALTAGCALGLTLMNPKWNSWPLFDRTAGFRPHRGTDGPPEPGDPGPGALKPLSENL